MRASSFNKKALPGISKIGKVLLLVIILLIMIFSIQTQFQKPFNENLFVLNQKSTQSLCTTTEKYCNYIIGAIKNCNSIPSGEEECSEEEKRVWAEYTQVTDCQHYPDCDENEKEAWDDFYTSNYKFLKDKLDLDIKAGYEDFKEYNAANNAALENLEPEFIDKVNKIAVELQTKPEYLLAVMNFETGGTFNPCVKNKLSGATGLIQFIEETAVGLGTSTAELCGMTRVEQLDYVKAHFMYKKGKLNTLEDVYMAVLWPTAVGKGSNYVIFNTPKQYSQNDGLDKNKDGEITVAEATNAVRNNAGSILS